MYISIKLPPVFGSFNRLRVENYPFNNLFTEYLDAVCKLGLSKGLPVGELVGWIEDRVFDGQRLPDVPDEDDGTAVNIRYRINDEKYPDIVKYITENGETTNRMSIMYIARMTLRLSVCYGMSLFRLKRVITDLMNEKPAKKQRRIKEEEPIPAPRPKRTAAMEEEPVPVDPVPATRISGRAAQEDTAKIPETETVPSAPRISNRTVQEEEPVKEQEPPKNAPNGSGIAESASAAMAAINELSGLAAAAENIKEGEIVETNPLLGDFLAP